MAYLRASKRAFIALVIIFTGASAFLFNSFYREARNNEITQLNEAQTIHVKQAARGIEDFFARWTLSLRSLSRMDAIIDNDAAGKRSLRLFYEANEGWIRSISRLDERGVMLYTVPAIGAVGTDISDQEHVRELLRDHKPVLSDVFRAVEGFDSVALHVPVFRGSEFKGSIGILVDFESLAKRYLDGIKVGETGYAWVVSRDGTVLYSPVPGITGKPVFGYIKGHPSLIAMVDDMLKGHGGVATYTSERIGGRNPGQTRKYAVYMPVQLGNTFWSIASVSTEEDVLSGLVSFRNKLTLVIGALFVCALVLSIAGSKAWLIVKEEEKRRQAEKKLEDRLRFEELLTNISARFISLPADRVDGALRAAQKQICEYLGVDICTIWQFSPAQPANLVMTHIYVPPAVPFEAPETIDAKESFPWCLEMVMKKEVIALSRIADAPPAAARDLESWKHYGIKSALTFPLFMGNGPSFGALGFNTVKVELAWTERLINSLNIVSQVFASALNRKFTERNLRETEEWLRDVIFTAADWVWEVDENGVYTYSSRRGTEILGRSREEIIGKTPFDFMPPEEAARVSAKFLETAAGRAPIKDLENWNIRKDGERVCLLTNGVPILDKDGNFRGYRGVDKDITARKRAEAALVESRAQIAAVMNSTKDLIWSVDPERFGLLTWNRAFSDYFLEHRGIRIEVGMIPAELVPPDYVPLWHGFFSRALREEFVAVEYVVVAKTRTLLLSLHTMRRDDAVFGISVFGRDITELKQAEAARLESMARYRAMVDAFDGFLYICSQDYRMEFMNQRLIERTGRNAVGETCYKALHGYDSVCEWCVNGRVFQGETVRWEVQSPKDNRWYYVVNTPIHHADGTTSKQSMIMDITERKMAEEALKESEQALRTSKKDLQRLAGRLISAQEEELRRLSRELHDDLTQRLAVLAIDAGKLELDLGRKPETSPETSLKLSQIKEQLIRVSEDVHAISRQLHPTILDDLGLVRAIESKCAMLMKGSDIEITFETVDVPDIIPRDTALCLYRIVQEGLRNVIRHSGDGRAEIVLTGNGSSVCLTIRDAGRGFDPAEVRQQPGLGLASMRERAGLVGGDFSIYSEPGKGAVITVCVPLTGGVT